MTKPIDTRHACQFCHAKTWNTDYVGFMKDHDRPQGGRCLRAARVYDNSSNPRAEAVKKSITESA